MKYSRKYRTSYWCLGLLPLLIISLTGCSVYDREKNNSDSGDEGGKGGTNGGSADASSNDSPSADAAAESSASDVAAGDSPSGDGEAAVDGSSDCVPHPNGDESCPRICPEVCDGMDNDCDGQTDELTEACNLPNATTGCEQNQCVLVKCAALYGNCDNNIANGCETRLDSLTDCGQCGKKCDGLSCAGGTCSALSCSSGLGDCNKNPDDGCETSLVTLTDCGLCGNQCAIANASSRCTKGECEFIKCKAGLADCDDDLSNGCETPLDTLADCGACGHTCTAPNGKPSCAGGRCTASNCDNGFADCNSDPADGCEVSLISVEHCGSCDDTAKCGPLEHATASCASGTCQIDACAQGYDDCDNEPSNGCETALNTNQNCGACRQACGFPNAVTSCETGVCEVSPCNEGYRDCNGLEGDGCEAELTAIATCGSCTNDCSQLPNVVQSLCSGSFCSVQTCRSGYGDCNNDPGCETPLNTTSNCSKCGDSCPANGGTAVCNGGVCSTICTLTGAYALKVTVAVTWSGTSYVYDGSGTYYSWSKLQATHSSNTLSGTLVECGKSSPAMESSWFAEAYKINYPNALFDHSPTYLPSVSTSATLSSASPGATFALSKTALLMGATMSDPVNGSWPSSASGLTQSDTDGDGKSGVSGVYPNSGSYYYPPTSPSLYANRADSVYVAARVVFSLSGTLNSCTQSTGSAIVTQANTRIFGCNRSSSSQDCDSNEGSFLDDNQRNYQPGTSTYKLVKIADAGTCADVRAAIP